MRTAIALASATPVALNATCWLSCECASVCPAWGVAACMGMALASGAAIFVTASTAWELHRFRRFRPPLFHTEGSH